MADFAWLEQALQAEYHGGIVLPVLSIALGVPNLETTQHEVDAKLLTNWLADVLNGVRGQGAELPMTPCTNGFVVLTLFLSLSPLYSHLPS